MIKIRAYIDYDDCTKTHYYKDFDLIEVKNLPKIGETTYKDSSSEEIVKTVEEVKIDCEQGHDDVYNYSFYKITMTRIDKDDNSTTEIVKFVCIENEE